MSVLQQSGDGLFYFMANDYIPYAKKLLDPKWKEKRYEIVDRDNYKCCYCSSTENLHVHHFCYNTETRNPWDVDSSALVTLCKTCHFNEHRTDLTPLESDLFSLLQMSAFTGSNFCQQILIEANKLISKHKK